MRAYRACRETPLHVPQKKRTFCKTVETGLKPS